MNRLLVTVSALALLLPAASFAQPNRDQNPGGAQAGRPGGGPPTRPAPGGRPGGGGPSPGVRPPGQGGGSPGRPGVGSGGGPGAGPGHGGSPGQGGRPPGQGGGSPGRPPGGGPGAGPGNPGHDGGPGQGGGRPPGQGGGSPSRPPSHGGGRPGQRPGGSFTYKGLRHPRYSAPAFRYPRGYAYRRWSIGQSLPLLFLSGSYFFDSYGALGLPPPIPGYRWVRYGPDLLLVDQRSGRIRDVVYNAFY
jgi:Ni/Co efflux regulator RcnB